jgi:outer membrane protein insertion porin family
LQKKNKYTKAVLTRGVTIETDSIYRTSKAKGSFSYYNSLSNFRLINFDFREKENNNAFGDTGRNYLYPHIKLTPQTPQSFTVELEGNTTSGKYGAGSSLLYRHLNVFGGAELLDLKFNVELNNQEQGTTTDSSRIFSDTEFGVNASIRFPNLLMPFSSRSFYLKYYPKTAFSLGYNFRYNSNYRRSIFSSSFGYDWRAK